MKNTSDTRLIAKAVYVWIFSITFGSAVYAIIFVLTHFDGVSFPIDFSAYYESFFLFFILSFIVNLPIFIFLIILYLGRNFNLARFTVLIYSSVFIYVLMNYANNTLLIALSFVLPYFIFFFVADFFVNYRKKDRT